MCQACYKLDLAVRNNPRAAQSILDEHHNSYAGREYVSQGCIIDKAYKGITWKGTWDPEDPRYNPYAGTKPKEEQ